MSPGGDSFRRVQSGETFQMPAAAYNAMLDAADSARAVKAIPGQIAATTSPAAPILVAYNGASSNAPRGAMVELRARGDTVAQIEFVRPGDEGGLDIYGVAIDPIPEGKMGRVAFSGGPWRVLAPVAAVGDTLGAVDGEWTAGVVGNGPLIVVRESIGGVAAAFFSRGSAQVGPVEITALDVANQVKGGAYHVGRAWTSKTISSEKFRAIVHFDKPITGPSDVTLRIQGESDPAWESNIWIDGYEDEQDFAGTVSAEIAAITEDFDIESATYSELMALPTANPCVFDQRTFLLHEEANHQSSRSGMPCYLIAAEVSPCYGLMFQIPHVNLDLPWEGSWERSGYVYGFFLHPLTHSVSMKPITGA